MTAKAPTQVLWAITYAQPMQGHPMSTADTRTSDIKGSSCRTQAPGVASHIIPGSAILKSMQCTMYVRCYVIDVVCVKARAFKRRCVLSMT